VGLRGYAEKPCKGSLNVRLGVDLHNRARMVASAKNISINVNGLAL